MLAAIAASLAGCSGDARRTASPDPLVVRIGTFGTKVPGRPTAGQLAAVLSAEPLISVGWDGRPIFRLAASAGAGADGRHITITLRSNGKFHTGEPITAAAVRDLLVPKLRRLAPREVADVTIEGERVLRIALQYPYALKPEDFSDYVIDDDERPALRTGPFKVVSTGATPVLERFVDYYRGAPAIERIEIHEYPTLRAAWTALMRGELNFLHEVNREAIEFLEGSDIRTYPLLRPYYVPLAFNIRHPLLRRRDVRLALSEAVDRDEVVHKGMAGHGRAAEGPFWPHHWAYEPGRHPVAHNPHAARLRLDAAGFRETRHGADRMPSRFRFTCLLPEGDSRFDRIALVLQRQLFSIGVEMELLPVPQADFVARIRSGDFDAFLFELASGRTLGFPYRLWHSRTAVLPTGYSSADEALDRMKLARTDEETRAAVADVMEIMQRDPPAIFLAMPREVRAADPVLEIPYATDRDVFGSLWEAGRAAPAE